MQVNLGECAGVFGVDTNTIRQWLRKGLPVVQRGAKGSPWVLETADVSDWLREREREEMAGHLEKTDIDEARRRKLAAEAALAELNLAKERGQVLVIDEVIERMAAEYAACKARLLALPTKLAAIAPVDMRNELRERFDDGIRECLAEIVSHVPPKDSGNKAA